MNKELAKLLKHYIDFKESELQDKIAIANRIDLDYSCDIVLEDYEDIYCSECADIYTLRNALKIIEGESE